MNARGSDPRHAVVEPVAPSPGLDEAAVQNWQRVSPLAALFFFGRMAKGFIGNLPTTIGSVATLAALARESIWYAVGSGVGLMALLAVVAILRFWFFRFCLGEQGVRIRQGVVKRNELDLRFHRIQGVNVEESLVYRWFGLVTVSFDTAGSSQQEGHLPAVRRQFATTLRQQIDEQRSSPSPAAKNEASAPGPRPEGARAHTAHEDRAAVLLQLGNADMLRIALTDPTVLILLAALPALAQYADSTSADFIERAANLAADELLELAPLLLAVLAVGALLAVLALFLAVTVVSAFLRFHGFRLSMDGNVFRARAGLLTHKEVVMDGGKVQQLRLTQSWALRCFGRYRLRVLPATSADNHQAGVAQTLDVPVLTPDAALDLRQRMLAGEGERLSVLPGDERFAAISKRYVMARARVIGVVPILLCIPLANLLPLAWVLAPAGLTWLFVVALCTWQRWRRWGYMHDDQGLAVRSGLIGARVEVFLFRKVQGAATTSSGFQRRHGLATLRVHLASGDVTVPFIDETVARQLRDYMIYKAESSRLAWH